MYLSRILGTDVSVPSEATNDEIAASLKRKIEEVNRHSLRKLLNVSCIHDSLIIRKYVLNASNQQFCCSLTSLKYSNLILISLEIYKK